MSVIKAGTTLTTAYTVEADTTGALEFKTGPSATLAMSISSSGVVTFPATTGFDIASANITNLTSRSLTVSAATYLATASGSVGIGTASPSAWTRKAIQISDTSQGYFVSNVRVGIGTNMFYDGVNKYIENRHGLLYLQDGSIGTHEWYISASGTAGGTISFTQAMILNSSGNLGLGVTPSAWASGQGALEFKQGGLSAWSFGTLNGYIYSNAYYDGANNRYINNGTACSYAINNGTGDYVWFQAASGTVGNTISFTQSMILTASGNLGLGNTPKAWGSGVQAFQFGDSGAAWARNSDNLIVLSANMYFNGTNDKYIESAAASRMYQLGGKFIWESAASGTADNNITWTQILSVEKDTTVSLQGATTKSGTGITFPATVSTSSDVNTLDDYEEGTWSPSVGGNATYNIQKGSYTKIGRCVTAMFDMAIASIGTGSTSQVGGLPFGSAPPNAPQGIVAPVSYWANLAISVSWVALRLDETSTTMSNQYTTGNQSTASIGGAIFQSGTRIIGTITYFV